MKASPKHKETHLPVVSNRNHINDTLLIRRKKPKNDSKYYVKVPYWFPRKNARKSIRHSRQVDKHGNHARKW